MSYRLVATCPLCKEKLKTVEYSPDEGVLVCPNQQCGFVEKLSSAIRKALQGGNETNIEARKLLKEALFHTHPDRYPNLDAATCDMVFRHISEARDLLKNEDKK